MPNGRFNVYRIGNNMCRMCVCSRNLVKGWAYFVCYISLLLSHGYCFKTKTTDGFDSVYDLHSTEIHRKSTAPTTNAINRIVWTLLKTFNRQLSNNLGEETLKLKCDQYIQGETQSACVWANETKEKNERIVDFSP